MAQYELGMGRRRSELSGSLRGREGEAGPVLLYWEAGVFLLCVLFFRGEEDSLCEALCDGIFSVNNCFRGQQCSVI